jgi:hypothetical protein
VVPEASSSYSSVLRFLYDCNLSAEEVFSSPTWRMHRDRLPAWGERTRTRVLSPRRHPNIAPQTRQRAHDLGDGFVISRNDLTEFIAMGAHGFGRNRHSVVKSHSPGLFFGQGQLLDKLRRALLFLVPDGAARAAHVARRARATRLEFFAGAMRGSAVNRASASGFSVSVTVSPSASIMLQLIGPMNFDRLGGLEIDDELTSGLSTGSLGVPPISHVSIPVQQQVRRPMEQC